ncbi:MAG: PKD domain-containing protein [Euryarchaeota archaeon]|nr:PKD domain-containing protein [Euryarchaeota archaeon]
MSMNRHGPVVGVLALAVVLLFLVQTPSFGPAAPAHASLPRSALAPSATSAGLTPTGSAFGLGVGDQVDVASASVNCRQAPNTAAQIYSVEPQFEQGVIVAGSVLADGYVWWEVSWDNNFAGWSAEGNNGTAWLANLTGKTVAYDRAAAGAYASTYWWTVASDGYFWDSSGSYVSYPQGTSVLGKSGDDCAHYSSQVIGNEPHQAGGGLNIPSRVPPTYGEPGAGRLGDILLSNGWAVQVNGVQSMEMGDLINYEWTSSSTTWDHIAVYLGNGTVTAHTNSHFGTNWTLGGFYAARYVHILGTSSGGSGIDHPSVGLTLSPSSGPAPLAVTASVTATGGSTVYASYKFLWGDGTSTTSSSPSASHTYTAVGTYSADVEVTDSLGATGWSANQTATAQGGGPPPLSVGLSANFTHGNAPLAVAFTATPQGGSGAYASFAWTFGDGSTTSTTTSTASHTYGGAGSFSATVKVVDSSGAPATSSAVVILVNSTAPPPLSVSLTAATTSGPFPLAVPFTANPSGGSGVYSTFSWSFGDGNTQTTSASTVTHTYTSSGTFSVTVTVDDGVTHATSTAVQVAVSSPSGPPTPISLSLGASATSGAVPFSATLSLSISGGRSPYRVAWDYGDGTSTGLSPIAGASTSATHTYTTSGTLVVTATVADALGTTVHTSLDLTLRSPGGSSSPPSSTPTGAAPTPLGVLLSAPTVYLLVAALGGALLALGVYGYRRKARRDLRPATGDEGADRGAWAPPPSE